MVDVVLVRPSRAANVAAACRAMKNMGLGMLRLIDPPPELAQPEARALAYGAWDLLDTALTARSLGEAVAESTLVVGTSARSSGSAWTPRRLAEEGGSWAAGGRVSLVFGPEASGLTKEELALCHVRVHIPADAAHPSLNLAQAVLLLAYEIRISAGRAEAPAVEPARATAGALEAVVQDLRGALLEIGYLNPANPGAILAELRSLLARAGPTVRELSLLRGLARQVAWAGRVARGSGAGR